jgi:hypothetical protein
MIVHKHDDVWVLFADFEIDTFIFVLLFSSYQKKSRACGMPVLLLLLLLLCFLYIPPQASIWLPSISGWWRP